MRNMSFRLTTDQIAEQTKTVTRRFGWPNLKAGDLLQPIVKGQGLKKGEKVQRIGPPIRILSATTVALDTIDAADCILEGFPHLHPDAFILMLVYESGCREDAPVNRIEFEYTDKPGKATS